MTHWQRFTLAQYNQIAYALLALPDTDIKANLVHILACNFIATDPNGFDQFRFIQGCYVKNSHRAGTVTHLEDHLDKRFKLG